MGRYRPPAPPRSKYITPEGKRELELELDELWRVKRPKVTKAVSEAAAQGDRSENAEYIYGKKQLREIDRRVRFLQKRLGEVISVDAIPDQQERIFFGAWVTICSEGGKERYFRIVGPDEFDQHPDYVSMDAPLAKSLLGKEIGQQIEVRLPDGNETYSIEGVEYKKIEKT